MYIQVLDVFFMNPDPDSGKKVRSGSGKKPRPRKSGWNILYPFFECEERVNLFRRIDDPGVVSKLQHPQHRREYAVGQEEGQALQRKGELKGQSHTKYKGE